MAGKITRSAEERFWEKVDKSKECWMWKANTKKRSGYGRFWYQGRNVFAHRFSWMLAFGVLDDKKLRVLHKCDTPGCVNPQHLFLGTDTENIADRDSKGRMAWGERNGNRKLTAEQVLQIRDGSDSVGAVAHRFQIDRTQVYNIRKRKQWAHL